MQPLFSRGIINMYTMQQLGRDIYKMHRESIVVSLHRVSVRRFYWLKPLKHILSFSYFILFVQEVGASHATTSAQAAAVSNQVSDVTDKMVAEEDGVNKLLKNLEKENKVLLVTPDTYKKPEQKKENTPTFILRKISIAGNKTVQTRFLRHLWCDYIGKKVTFNLLNQITKKITGDYRKRGYFLSYAVIPEQKINPKEGKITLRVIEGYVSRIKIQHADRKKISERTGALISFFRKRPLRVDDFERALLLIRDLHPDTKAYFEAVNTDQSGATQLKLIIPPKQAVHGFVSFNNYGTSAVGPVMESVGLSIAPPWQEEHQLDLNYQQALLTKEYRAGILSYTFPLRDNGLSANIRGTALSSTPTSAFNIHKKQEKLTWTMLYPFVRSINFNFYGGLELRYINQRQTVSDFSQLTRERVRQLKVLALFDWSDAWAGKSSLSFRAFSGLNILHPISDNSPHKTRASGNGKPLYFTMNFSRLQRLMGPFSARFQVDTQYAARSLLNIDRFYSKGAPLDGAYPAAAMAGDSGIEAKIELIYSMGEQLGMDDVQLFSYLSQIRTWNRTPIAGLEKYSEIARGAGIGLRFTYHQITGTLEYGYPIIAPVGGNSINPKVLFSLAGRI